ncbi:unnamed protein product [Allacma fusca]|uniref:Sulfakinin n=1 Tax=Allacma fusca TaxID=39272 RepID=A0A8J2KQE0_9HEXA|nr:unnamed protein product [Allacma fusca]
MRNVTILVFALALFSMCLLRANCERSSTTNPVSGAKKIRPLNPSATRLYHLLRLGMTGGVDDEDLQSDDDNFIQKRQYDDYGHMRFGKRNPPGKEFDDYGHLRFGK